MPRAWIRVALICVCIAGITYSAFVFLRSRERIAELERSDKPILEIMDSRGSSHHPQVGKSVEPIAQGRIDDLSRELSNGKDQKMRVAAAEELGALADKRVEHPLIAGSTDPDAVVRGKCIAALGQHPGPGAQKAVEAALSDVDVDVRANAAVSLAMIHAPESLKPLLARLSKADDNSEISMLLLALNSYADEAIPELERMRSSLPATTRSAVEAWISQHAKR
jgi:HEAT repeat protein